MIPDKLIKLLITNESTKYDTFSYPELLELIEEISKVESRYGIAGKLVFYNDITNNLIYENVFSLFLQGATILIKAPKDIGYPIKTFEFTKTSYLKTWFIAYD